MSVDISDIQNIATTGDSYTVLTTDLVLLTTAQYFLPIPIIAYHHYRIKYYLKLSLADTTSILYFALTGGVWLFGFGIINSDSNLNNLYKVGLWWNNTKAFTVLNSIFILDFMYLQSESTDLKIASYYGVSGITLLAGTHIECKDLGV